MSPLRGCRTLSAAAAEGRLQNRRTGFPQGHSADRGPRFIAFPRAKSCLYDRATGDDLANRVCLLNGPLLVFVRVGILAAVIIVLAVRHLNQRGGDDAEEPTMCNSRGCAAMAALLADSTNLSQDPCTDFTAYVCSGRWQNSGEPSQPALAVLQRAWSGRMHKALEERATSTRTIGKAARMYRSCINRGNEDVSSAEDKLEDVYWRFPEGGEQSYTHQWLYARRNASGLVIKNVYDELSRLPHFYYDHPITYDLPHNTIAMPATAFMEPLYFTDGTDAMLYGSLGSTLAMKVLSVVSCDRGKREEGCGYPAVFNLAAASRYVCEKDSASLGRPEEMALQVAYSAYANASKASSDMKLQNLSEYSASQIFFLVWCYTRCFDGAFRSDVTVCDDAVTVMPAFREAFGCGSVRAK
ncbi:hypothetical protein HPB52_025666 [Rhipicephalus sanguineus]|uniref:Uncharacterized protein n=1 Tax=Rhipicephalus sanguineus TaxID=34632 RepID=A0A9D4TCU0_RHISA|nr:hypothetical protein HPB52_025666 [Rhipicephalus sanguineus]